MGKFAMRALSQSLAREFGPQGIHVVHAIIDGVIDIERTKSYKFDHPEAKIKPEAVSIIDLYGMQSRVLIWCGRLLTRTGTCTRNPGLVSPTRLTSVPLSRSGDHVTLANMRRCICCPTRIARFEKISIQMSVRSSLCVWVKIVGRKGP